MSTKLNLDFFAQDTLTVAKELLGEYLVRKIGSDVFVGKIVETEAYIGENDLACHASKGRTERTEVMYGEPGRTYIYMIYGMYYCLNIVTEKVGKPCAVLIRAVEPIIDDSKSISNYSKNDFRKMGFGPGRLCRWLNIGRKFNGEDITKSKELFIVSEAKTLNLKKSEIKISDIQSAKRIGVNYAKHCAHFPWRFVLKK